MFLYCFRVFDSLSQVCSATSNATGSFSTAIALVHAAISCQPQIFGSFEISLEACYPKPSPVFFGEKHHL